MFWFWNLYNFLSIQSLGIFFSVLFFFLILDNQNSVRIYCLEIATQSMSTSHLGKPTAHPLPEVKGRTRTSQLWRRLKACQLPHVMPKVTRSDFIGPEEKMTSWVDRTQLYCVPTHPLLLWGRLFVFREWAWRILDEVAPFFKQSRNNLLSRDFLKISFTFSAISYTWTNNSLN